MFIPLLLSGCFYKSVMNGEADDILKAAVYHSDGGDYLVMLEAVFQATSKEGGRGMTTITGYNELRISVYNLADGSLVARKKTGRQIKEPIVFLGCSEGNLWFFSARDGIHSLDPGTLEIRISQDSIFGRNPDLRNNLATSEWYRLPQFFQFNDITQSVVLTDNKGFRYLLDTSTLEAKRVTWEYKLFDPRYDQIFETSVFFPEPRLTLSGDLRKIIYGKDGILNPDLSFLDGKFLVDRHPERILKKMDSILSANMSEAEVLYSSIIRLNSMNNGNGPSRGSLQRDTLLALNNWKYRLESAISRMEEVRRELIIDGQAVGYNQLLSPDSSVFFVFHRAGTAKNAEAIITKLRLNGNHLRESWSTVIPGFFFDPSAASETDIFKEVFSKGNPEFRFAFADMAGKKLIMVRMLHGVCLDMESGKILWKIRI